MNRIESIALDEALARAGDGVCVIGEDGRILLWNRAAERALGYTAREVTGRQCCDVFVGYDDDGNRLCYQGCHVMSLVKMGEAVQSFDMRTRNKAGRPVWLNVSILAVPNTRANGPLTIHLFRDVTATKDLLTMVHERLTRSDGQGDHPDPAALLTRREVEVLRLLSEGLNTRRIADRLHVSTATVRNHVQNIFGKLGVHSRLEAAAYANRHRLL